MPDATITSTASTFGTISGTFAADQSTITGTITGVVSGTLTGSVGVPGPQGPAGPGSTWGGIAGVLSNQLDLQAALDLKAPLASPVFTGDARAVTPAFGDNDTSIATTAFVQAGLLGGTANAKNLEVYVRNQSGSTIAAGAIVYISGATGNRPLITLAQANNDANSAQTMGFVKEAIANNGFGYVIVRGELENIDTSALTEGVQLYLSPTTPGAWTTTKPSAPQHLVYVGIVVRSHPTQGTILVAVQNGYELDELHDVSIASKANNNLLAYESATNLWKNKTYSALGLLTTADAAASFYPLASNPAGYLTSASLSGYATESWVTSQGYITSAALTPYLTKADNLGSLTNFATARDNLGLGTLSSPTFAGITAQGSGANVANLTPTSLSLNHATSGSFTIQPSVGIVFPDGSTQTTAFTGSAPGYITSVSSPLSVSAGNLTIDLSAYLTSATAASVYQTQAGMSSYLTTASASATYYPLTNPSGYITSSALTGYATQAWVDAQGYLQSGALTGYALESWVTSQGYLTSGSLVGYATESYVTSALTGYATESWVIGLGYITSVDANAAFYPLTGNPSGFVDSSALIGYATESWVTSGFYPLTGNPSGFITSAALSPYLLSSTAASTYQTIAGMSSYLTTSAAATNYLAKSGGIMTGGLTFNPGAGGYLGTFQMLPGNSITIPDGGAEVYETILQNKGLLVRDASNVALARFEAELVLIPSVGITFSDASVQTTAGISASTAASTYQTIAGMSSYAPKASPALTGNVTITSNSSGAALFIEQAGTGNILTLHDQASDTSFVAIDQNGKVNTIASTTTNAGFNVPHGTAPSAPVNGDVWTTTAGLFYQINGSTISPATLAGGTFTGKITTATATTAGAGFRIPTVSAGNAPTSPTAGDMWIITGATGSLVFQGNGTQTVATLGYTQTFTGNNTFSGATLNFGNATTATTIGLGNGATATATTKTLNIGTGGVAGSTTTINIGTTGGGSATANVNALLISRASTATEAGLRILPGTAPTSPVNGDVWTDTAGIYARINGATQNLVPPALATLSEARQFTNDTKVMSPRDTLWSMLSQDFIDIDGPSMTVTNTGTITSVQVGQLSRSIRPGNAGACSSRIRTFGISQVDQTWTATSRAQPASFLNFSLRSIHSGRSTTSGVTDANYTCAFYYGKAEADGVGDLTRRGYGWKMVGGAGSRFLQLQAHNGTTLSSVTSSFAVTAGVAFDWDIESDGAGNVTLYVNGSSVATSNGGPTGSVNITAVAWQEEVVAAAALSSPFMDFTNSRGRFIVINTW